MKSLKLSAVCGVLLLGGQLVKKQPALVEQAYARTLYPPIARFLGALTGWTALSVFECLLWSLPLILAGLCWQAYRTGALRRRVAWPLMGSRLLAALLLLVLLFEGLWGFNYHRQSIAEQLEAPVAPRSTAELAKLCTQLIADANRLSIGTERDASGVMVSRGPLETVLARAGLGIGPLGERLVMANVKPGRPKAFSGSFLLSYTGIAGIYFPYTGEANVNGDVIPALLPATAVHELAHAEGYAREDEANFIAWAACRLHPDADYQYSGALLAVIMAMNALYEADPDQWRTLTVQYAPAVRADLKANSSFWKRYEGPAEKAQDHLNDRYLKMNGQADGVRSYGRMVDLLLAFGGDPKTIER